MRHHICSAILLLLIWEARAADKTTRITCNTAGFQCSSDCSQLGYCDGINWHLMYSCPSGQLCVNGACGNYASCPSRINYNILCSDSNLKMPNLEDSNCETYYSCTATTASAIGYGQHETCASGTIFDPCSGQCINRQCPTPTPTPCSTITTPAVALTNNEILAYTCISGTGGLNTLWLNCSNGLFTPNSAGGVQCTPGLNNGCNNGNGRENVTDPPDEESCTIPGKYPITGNTCSYRWCFADGSSSVYKCGTGYHFDAQTRQCVAGSCT